MNARLVTFLKKHHVLTLATVRDGMPWVAHCFYAFLEKDACLVFTTDPETRHGEEMLAHPQVACGIAWETKRIGQIRGAQVSGRAHRATDNPAAKSAYLRRFPYAAALKLDLWVLEMDSIKFTDNRLGFGKKLTWNR